MAIPFAFKRTSVSGRAANSTTLPAPGNIALNMADGIMYSTNGSVIFEIGANNTNSQVTGNLVVSKIVANGALGTSGLFLTANSTGYVYFASPPGGGGSADIAEVTVDFGAVPVVAGKSFNVAVVGALTTQQVSATPSYKPATGVDVDEFDLEPWNVAGYVIADDVVRLHVFSSSGRGFLHGEKNINLIIG